MPWANDLAQTLGLGAEPPGLFPRVVSMSLKWLAFLVAVVVAVVALIWVTQRRLIYFPTQRVPDPASVLSGVEEVTFSTEDDLTLAAWWMSASDDLGTVVLFNGNAGNRADRLPLAAAMAESGYSVLLVDYRGYGGNPGRPSEEGLARDARAARAYLETRPDVDPAQLVYFGESLGAGVALALARDREPAALVLRSPFTSLPDIASVHYPFLPTSLLLWDRYPNKLTIRDVAAPVLVVAGVSDSIVPVEQSKVLYETALEPKRLVLLDGADHNDFALTAGPELVDEVVSFLAEVLPDDG